MISNRDHDLASFVRAPLAPGAAWQTLRTRPRCRAGAVRDLSRRPARGARVEQRAGRHELELLELATNRSAATVDLPGEIVESLTFSADGAKLALTVSGATQPQDIWLLETAELSQLRRLTHSPHIGVDLTALAGATLLEYAAHDELPLSGWLYTPRPGSAPYPTVLSFHGGPEGQEQPALSLRGSGAGCARHCGLRAQRARLIGIWQALCQPG